MIFISTYKSGTNSIGFALEKLGYKTLGYKQEMFSFSEYIEIFKANTLFSEVKDLQHCSLFEEIKLSLGFIYKKEEINNTEVFHDWPMGHECIDPVIKKVMFPESKFIFSKREKESWLKSVNKWYSSNINNYNYTIRMRDYHEKRINIVKKEFPKDVLVYNINDKWKPICDFLGKEIPEIEFPHINKQENRGRKGIDR